MFYPFRVPGCAKVMHDSKRSSGVGMLMITDAGTDYTLPSGSYYMEYCGCSEEIDRPRSGNHTESETRSRDFPWVSSTTNDPAAVPWMLLQL